MSSILDIIFLEHLSQEYSDDELYYSIDYYPELEEDYDNNNEINNEEYY